MLRHNGTGAITDILRKKDYNNGIAMVQSAVNHQWCLFVLRFFGPVNPMGSCRARSVYLTTRLLGRLSPLSG